MRFLSFVLIGLAFFSGSAFADVQIGQSFPVSLELNDSEGAARSFDSVKGKKGSVIVFVRSVDWCPYCQVQLLGLKDDGASITDLGYSITAVSYDAPELQKKFKTRYKFPYLMLSDEGSKVIQTLGILNDKFEPDHFAYGVPHPKIYIVGADGVVQDILEEESYKKRPQVDVIVNSIKSNR